MQFEDVLYEKKDGTARVIINRAKRGNALRTKTLLEMIEALEDAADDHSVGVIVITGAGEKAFCTGGDSADAGEGKAGYSRGLKKIFEVERLVRMCQKPVIAAVNGWAVGGGHVLHVLCDLTIASETAKFAQVGPKVGSFEAGFGAAYLARLVGEKKAREMWFLCRTYTAQEALAMGLVNKVVPPDKLMEEVDNWCEEILQKSPTALAFLKNSLNMPTDWIYGLQRQAGEGLWQYYASDEAMEGRKSFLEKRKPDFKQFRR
ncbi:MAG: enoyl-CoA hydratase-related protein [Thermodesulfobacteriota bacterium]